MDRETLKLRIINKIQESTEIKKSQEEEEMSEYDKERDKDDDKKHPNKRSDKEKRNVVLFFKELAEDVFTEDYDNSKEGYMANNQVTTIARYSVLLKGLIEDSDDLPEWLEKKLTLAEENITICYNYLMNETERETKKTQKD